MVSQSNAGSAGSVVIHAVAGVLLTLVSLAAAASPSASPIPPTPPTEEQGYTITPVPDWVRPVPAFDDELPVSAEPYQGYHARLQDFQYNGLVPGQSSYFKALEYTLSNRYGVENHSSIEIAFDPSYEALSLHELWILRGDVLLDKLPTARRDLLRTESDRSELIYDGTRTLAIVLDDVRRGDKIRYSYSVAGENPIFEGNREIRVSTELWRPLDRNYTRILTSSERPFSRRVRGADIDVQLSEAGGVQEMIIDQLGVPEFSLEEYVPSWHYNRGTVVFSDMADWQSVVDWALPMYQLAEERDADIATIASVIRSSQRDIEEQIGAALRWVQEEVRYFGVELGKNSHWPSRPEETLARRFGDCKDKSLLLMALLRELGVDAQAALVNTERGLESASYPHRLHAFNHVVVQVQLDGEVHFLDPTLRNQAGALGELREPDYGRALVLSADTTALSTMQNRQVSYRMAVRKTLSQSDMEGQADTRLVVYTNKQGRWAENLRHDIETDGVRGLGSAYLTYYDDYFTGVVALGEPDIVDGPGNAIQVTEHYRIPELWMADENASRYRWIHADEVMGYLDLPERTLGRQQPYEVVHPIDIEERWEINIPIPMRMEELDAVLESDWFSFSKRSEWDEEARQLSVIFRYRTKANEVSAEDLSDYAAAVSQVYDLASFYLEDKPSLGAAVKEAAGEVAKAGSLHPLVLLLFVAGFLWRRVECRS